MDTTPSVRCLRCGNPWASTWGCECALWPNDIIDFKRQKNGLPSLAQEKRVMAIHKTKGNKMNDKIEEITPEESEEERLSTIIAKLKINHRKEIKDLRWQVTVLERENAELSSILDTRYDKRHRDMIQALKEIREKAGLGPEEE